MYCKKCGKEIKDDFKVCPHCGLSVINGENRILDILDRVGGIIAGFGLLGAVFAFMYKMSMEHQKSDIFEKWDYYIDGGYKVVSGIITFSIILFIVGIIMIEIVKFHEKKSNKK